jgi:hypothetical protein
VRPAAARSSPSRARTAPAQPGSASRRQDKLDAAFLEALADAIDDRLLNRAATKAVERLRRHGTETTDQRTALMRERDRTAAGIRNLVDAVKLGRATDILLRELEVQEAALKSLERRIADLDGRRVVPIDGRGRRLAWRPWRGNFGPRSRRAARRPGDCCSVS